MDSIDDEIARLLAACAGWDAVLIDARAAWGEPTDDRGYAEHIEEVCDRAQDDRVALRLAIRERLRAQEVQR